MCHRTLAIHCFIDDFLKARGHRKDSRAEVSDTEVITIALTAMLNYGFWTRGTFKKGKSAN